MWLAKRYVMMWLATVSSFIHSSCALRLGVSYRLSADDYVEYMVKGHFYRITLLHYEYNIIYDIIFFLLMAIKV